MIKFVYIKISIVLLIFAWACYSCSGCPATRTPFQIVDHSNPVGNTVPDLLKQIDILNQQELQNRMHLIFIYFVGEIEIDPQGDGNFITVTAASQPDASRLIRFRNSNNIGLSFATSWQFPQGAYPVLIIDPKVPIEKLISDTYRIDLDTSSIRWASDKQNGELPWIIFFKTIFPNTDLAHPYIMPGSVFPQNGSSFVPPHERLKFDFSEPMSIVTSDAIPDMPVSLLSSDNQHYISDPASLERSR